MASVARRGYIAWLAGLFGATLSGSSWLFGRSALRGLRGSLGLRCVALREVRPAQGYTLQALLHACYYDACSGLQDMLCLLVKLCLWSLGSASMAWLVCAVVCVDGASGGHASCFRHCCTLAKMIHAVHAVLSPAYVVLTCQAVLLMVS